MNGRFPTVPRRRENGYTAIKRTSKRVAGGSSSFRPPAHCTSSHPAEPSKLCVIDRNAITGIGEGNTGKRRAEEVALWRQYPVHRHVEN